MDTSLLSWKKNEAVFVIGVLAVIFGISFFQLRISQMKTRDVQRKADIELVGRALVRYYEDYGVFPKASAGGEIMSCGREGWGECAWGEGPMVDLDEVVYLPKLPVDPFAFRGWKYVYEVDDDRLNFKIFTALEYSSDPEYKRDLTTRCGENVECRWYVTN